MAEKSISFNSEMVKAILAGKKTQTRRPAKGQLNPFVIGDKLWVKEKWAPAGNSCIRFDSDGFTVSLTDELKPYYWADSSELDRRALRNSWKPSTFMPREASRITLEITAVRAERLQDISEEDVEAEGFPTKGYFELLWDGIYHKKGFGWDKNPWVWVISFKKLEKDHGRK